MPLKSILHPIATPPFVFNNKVLKRMFSELDVIRIICSHDEEKQIQYCPPSEIVLYGVYTNWKQCSLNIHGEEKQVTIAWHKDRNRIPQVLSDFIMNL